MTGQIERCPICGARELVPYGSRPEGACSGCRAKERTRTMFLMLRKLKAFDKSLTVLHIAPEKALVEKFHACFGSRYTICDIRAEALQTFSDSINKIAVDIVSFGSVLAGKKFDLIIHSHVMEHVRASWPLVFLRLHSLLNPGGLHVFAVPLIREWSKEDLAEMAPEARRKAFGQHDHYRYIGKRDFGIDLQNIVALTKSEPVLGARDILAQSEMTLIAGDPDVYVLKKSLNGEEAL